MEYPRFLILKAQQQLCFLFRKVVVFDKAVDASDVALALGLGEGGHEVLDGHAAFGGVAGLAGDGNVLQASGSATGAGNDVVVGDAGDGKGSAAVDAASAGLLGEDGEAMRGLYVGFESVSAVENGEILQKEIALVRANQALPCGVLDTEPVCQPLGEWPGCGEFGHAHLVFGSDAVTAEDCLAFYADILACVDGEDSTNRPVTDVFPAAAADDAAV